MSEQGANPAGGFHGPDVEEDLADLFENAPCGYVSARPDGRITKVNRTLAAWLGYGKDGIAGRRFQDLLTVVGKIYYETHFAPLLRMQGFFNEVALDLVGQGGQVLPALVNAVERRDASGEVRFIRVTVFNASDRRRYERELLEARRAAEAAGNEVRELNQVLEARIAEAVERRMEAEAALRQAQKMEAIGQLAAGVAHDFNNLLQGVTGSLELMLEEVGAGTPARAYGEIALGSARRGASLTQQLLSYARKQVLQPRPLGLVPFLSDLRGLLARTLGPHVTVEVRTQPAVPPVLADPGQLQAALLNLAINASQAMAQPSPGLPASLDRIRGADARPGGGTLLLEARSDGDDGARVVLAVSDTGVGMDEATAARAFEPFFTTKGVHDSGLGLSMVQGFAEQSGGEVHIRSAPGTGTTVELWLPAAQQGTEGPGEPSGSPVPSPLRGSGRVLLVEDALDVQVTATAFLERAGFRVVQAESGSEALAVLVGGERFDALVSDYAMPGLSGVGLIRQARAIRPGLPALLITGFAEVGGADELPEAVAVLRKPFLRDELVGAVLATMGRDKVG